MKLKNEALQILYDTIVNCTIAISPYADSLMDKAFKECDEKLQNRIDMLQQDHESDVRVIGKLHSQMVDLEDEKTEQEKRADILKSQRDMLKSQLDGALEAKKAINDSRYKWAQKWLSTKQNLEAKLNEAEVKYRRLEKEHKELASDYQMITIENKRLQDGLRDIGYEQGQTDLWDMLQNVNDTQPNEFDVECESMEDVIGMDLEDFLDCYKKWQEEKEIDRMRKWLADFCYERDCKGCPLESKEYKCGCGYSFRKTDPSDLRIIPDKDIKRYYEKAHDCGRYTLKDAKLFATTVEGVNRAISKACEGFCEAVRDADTKITENLRKGCTFEAEVKVDKDLFEKLCGIKSEVEEHKFEYGDAVRLPWRDYDYMYIGPYEESKTLVRMFDPKMHAMVISHIGNVRYNGGKIIICDEDDLRKIWKDKK